MDNKEKYYYASGVDINKNFQKNEEKRAIGYDGEYAVFCVLLDHFLDEKLKVLMNVNVPTGYGAKTTEIDCLLICKVGFVSFEIKNFKGTIYGRPEEEKWTQYFRTAKNQVFQNPLKQNEYHIQALQSRYPGIPCYSVVVFTNPDCDVSRVSFQERQGATSVEFCISIRDMVSTLQRIFSRNVALDDTKINKLFEELCQYAVHFTPVPTKSNRITSFNNLLAEAREQIGRVIRDMQEATRQAVENARVSRVRTVILASTLSVAIILSVGLYAKNRIDWYSGQYEQMHEKFQQVSNADFDIDLDTFCIENFSFERSDVFDANELSFSIGLTHPDTNLGDIECKQAELIVQLKNGEVLSYNVRENSEVFRYTTSLQYHGYKASSELAKIGEFLVEYDLSEIDYIKITNLVFYEDVPAQIHNAGHEIELTVYQD